MPARASMPLYPSEKQIAVAVLGEDNAEKWPAVAAHDERKGLPPIDEVHGGRPWPLVEKFYLCLMGLDRPMATAEPSAHSRVRIIDTASHREEDPRAEKDAALRGRRRDRRPVRARA